MAGTWGRLATIFMHTEHIHVHVSPRTHRLASMSPIYHSVCVLLGEMMIVWLCMIFPPSSASTIKVTQRDAPLALQYRRKVFNYKLHVSINRELQDFPTLAINDSYYNTVQAQPSQLMDLQSVLSCLKHNH